MMKTITLQKLLQIACCFICAILSLKLALRFDNPEWNEGCLTAPLLDLNDTGVFILLFAFVLAFINPRKASICALIGSILYLPLSLYVVSPRLFFFIFPSSSFRHPPPIFVWDGWVLAGILMLIVAAYICFRGFPSQSRI